MSPRGASRPAGAVPREAPSPVPNALATDHVTWHDLECGAYRADLPLWRDLAGAGSGPVLDVGAGTGRVALDLARCGHQVVGLDVDAVLLAALLERDASLKIIVADARTFETAMRFSLVVTAMQTIHLFGNARSRHNFLSTVRRCLSPSGRIALAVAQDLRTLTPSELDTLPWQRAVVGSAVYRSRVAALTTTSITPEEQLVVLERRRERLSTTGREAWVVATSLHIPTKQLLAIEARRAQLDLEDVIDIPKTREHAAYICLVLRKSGRR